MPLRYFLSTIKRRMLYLPRVSKWDDPYELFLFKQKFINSHGVQMDTISQAHRIYGQCWTTSRDSDAMWRIYSPDKMSVRIKTTIQNIEDITKSAIGKGLFIMHSHVVYKSQKEIDNYIKTLTCASVMGSNTLQESLFVKRNNFEHEKEYRMIAWLTDVDENGKPISYNPEYIELPFADNFIQEVYLDPRLTTDEADMLKSALSLRLGGSCSVSQSKLYKFKQHTIY